ncbi:F0F1 ATP synthase subunit epsilon [Vagococcus humatus]|uniref:ATP synthase epsilon chain n=1 Tax=Vagococcus humatus TaxID=1889241 RepID=A0A3S0AYQ1_9ENTE|nr:F0F1 ATP synthase subunit epsilon [Vagococcus humatus]RST90149.1 F0F1 ATP synthase subunit epsilon [Vagococcus humatus]
MALVQVEVVTPNGLVYEHEAKMVIGRTTEGDIGIMANHAPIIVPLVIDEVRIKLDDGTQEIIAVSGGIMEVRDNVITVLVDSAEKAEDIDVPRAERAKQRAEKRIQEAKEQKNADKLRRAEVSLRRAINRINISNKY